MRLVLIGPDGQLGRELQGSLATCGDLISVGRKDCDLSRPETIAPILDAHSPDVVVNAGAYTAVDRAEQEEALATVVNGFAVGELAKWSGRNQALLVHYSTDYVFSGAKDTAYSESDLPEPINAYGRSKRRGEVLLSESDAPHICLRTSWLYASHGANFLRRIIRLAMERKTLRVVSDQVGSPTSARDLANATARLVTEAQRRREQHRFHSGLYHLTGGDVASWHSFAEHVIGVCRDRGLNVAVESVVPIQSADYQSEAKRPLNSTLSNAAIQSDWSISLPSWKASATEAVMDVDL